MKNIVRLDFKMRMFEGRDRIERTRGVDMTYPLHTHTFYEYFLVTHGRAFHMVNGSSQLLSRGSLVLIRPHDEHYYDYYRKDDFEFLNVGVSTEEFQRVTDYYGVSPQTFSAEPMPRHIHLSPDKTTEAETLLTDLLTASPGEGRVHLFFMDLSVMLFHILNGDESNPVSALPMWLMNAIQEMEKPENFIAGLPRLLALSYCSQAHVNRVFRRYLYTTPTHYINDLRIRYAHKLLTTTSSSVTSIASTCGFNNISYFYTVFKQRCGLCPNALRHSLAGT